jgi:ribosomal protein S18 acetylase RimI-like enzyme
VFSGTAFPAAGDVPGDFVPVWPQEFGGWLRRADELAWAADPRELEVAAACGHRWTSWNLAGDTVAFCKVGGRRVFVVDFDKALCLPGGLAYLSDVYVLPGMRRKGIGRGLLARTLEFLGENSFTGVVCHIPERNEPSAALFRSLGFELLGKVRFTRVLGIPAFSTRPEELLQRASQKCASSSSADSACASRSKRPGRSHPGKGSE